MNKYLNQTIELEYHRFIIDNEEYSNDFKEFRNKVLISSLKQSTNLFPSGTLAEKTTFCHLDEYISFLENLIVKLNFYIHLKKIVFSFLYKKLKIFKCEQSYHIYKKALFVIKKMLK